MAMPLNPALIARLPTKIVNRPFTMLSKRRGVAQQRLLWHGAAMQRPNVRAGGCFLTIAILAGFVVGLAIGNPMKGVLAGTGVGILLAVALWLIDRRRVG